MPRSSFTATQLTVHPTGEPNSRRVLSEFADGRDLLHLLHGLLLDIAQTPLTDERWGLTVGEVAATGRTVRFTATTDARDDADAVFTRNCFVLPRGLEYGFLLTERYGGRAATTVIVHAVQAAFRARFGSARLVLAADPTTDIVAWQAFTERAALTEVLAEQPRPTMHKPGGFDLSSVGEVEVSVKPARGHAFLAEPVKRALLSGRLGLADITGIALHADAEVTLELDDGRQRRRLVLGAEEHSGLLYPITGEDEPRPGNELVYDTMNEKVYEFAAALGIGLVGQWWGGPWTQEQLRVRMAAVRQASTRKVPSQRRREPA